MLLILKVQKNVLRRKEFLFNVKIDREEYNKAEEIVEEENNDETKGKNENIDKAEGKDDKDNKEDEKKSNNKIMVFK